MSTGERKGGSAKPPVPSTVILGEELSIDSSKPEESPTSTSSKSSAKSLSPGAIVPATCDGEGCGVELGVNFWADIPGVGNLCPKCHKKWCKQQGFDSFG